MGFSSSLGSLLRRFVPKSGRTFPIYRQLDQMDCGPACLRMVAKHYGRVYSLPYLRERSYITREGVSLLGIAEAAEAIGLRSLGVRVPFDLLPQLPVPFIAHWAQNHFVVVYRVTRDRVYIADPAAGRRVLSHEEFKKGWVGRHGFGSGDNGILLALEPTPDFYQEEGESAPNRMSWGYLGKYLLKYKSLILQLFLGLGLGTLMSLIGPFLTQAVVDFGIENQDINFVYAILIAQLMVFVGRITVEFIRSWILLHIGQRLNISIVADFLSKLMRLPVPFFDRRTVGDVLQRIQDQNRIENFLTSTTLNVLFSIFNVIVYGAILLFYNWLIFVVFFVGSVASMIWVLFFMHRRRLLDDRRFAELSDEQSNVVQLVSGMTEIKLNNVERPKRWEWEHIQARRFRTNVKSLALGQYQQGGTSALQQLTSIVVVFLAASAVISGQMTLGMMMAVQQIVGQLSSPIDQFIGFIQAYQDAKLSLERMSEIYSHPEEESGDALAIPPEGGGLYIDDLSFQYEGPRSPFVLENLTLEIPEGKVTAIVGVSGSGKTTLLKLLLKFYEPVKGEIRLGGLNLGSVSTRAWRDRCGVVMQDGFIFHDTIARNIAMDPEAVDLERVSKAAEMANIRSFTESLPLGFNTKIGRDGHVLSQGQKQRILIARAIYKDPDYLFFDEATSALDANNERAILEKLDRFFEGRTVVVIAHRLSTVKNADQIVVLDKGFIVEQGTHRELAERKGRYFQLVRNQLELGV